MNSIMPTLLERELYNIFLADETETGSAGEQPDRNNQQQSDLI